jgi:predicted O-linked N-acetylglucosamine transferase (SPINDLY family)
VLEATPGSQLLVNHSLLGRPALRRALQAMLLEAGIPEDRLRLQAGGSWTSFLDQYAQVDAILDTSPYSGGQTTLEALWMGVPVLTVPGDRIASRHSTCHLRAAGLSQWSFPSAEALVQGAALLVQQEEERRAWRVQLREQLLDSPICDRRGHARAFWQRAHDAGQGGWT